MINKNAFATSKGMWGIEGTKTLLQPNYPLLHFGTR